MKAILFDFGGTLDADGRAWLERFRPIYKEAGVETASERFDRAFYDSDDSLPSRFLLKGLSLENTLLLQVRCVLESLALSRCGLAEIIAGRFLQESRAAFCRNRPLLESLRRRYRLGIVSNFYGNLSSVLASERLLDLFDVVADSGELGLLKPDGAIFQHALRALDCAADQALMVGDSVPRDMRGAEGQGMAHALLAPLEKAACCPKVLRLTALNDLEAALASPAAA